MGFSGVPTVPVTGFGGMRNLFMSKIYSHSLMAVRSLITMMPSASYLLATPAIPPPTVAPGMFVGIPPGRGDVSRPWIIDAAADCGTGLTGMPGWLNDGGFPFAPGVVGYRESTGFPGCGGKPPGAGCCP